MTGIIEAVRDWVSLFLILGTLFSIVIVKTDGFWKWVSRKTNPYCPNIARIEMTMELSRASLGALIYKTCNECLNQGHISDRDREWVIENFAIYARANGNGKVKDAYIRTLELKTHYKED